MFPHRFQKKLAFGALLEDSRAFLGLCQLCVSGDSFYDVVPWRISEYSQEVKHVTAEYCELRPCIVCVVSRAHKYRV